jgi:hypothetical protein
VIKSTIIVLKPFILPQLILILSLLIVLSPVSYSQNSFSEGQESLEGTVFTFPISGEVRDAFSDQPVGGATARFIILPDSISFSSDYLGYFDGKWTSIEEAVVHNYPNPFNPSTTIQFPAGFDILEIYTILGQLLSRVDLRAESQIELEMASGVYVYRLRDNETGKVAQNKMIALDGGYFTIYFEKVERSRQRPTNMFNRANSNFDDFSEVKIIHEGYAPLDTNVRLIEGVRNNFLFLVKPYVSFILNGQIRDNYGNAIYNSRLILIRNPLNDPDTLFNQLVPSSFSTPPLVRVVKLLDDVMLKVIRYRHDTYVEYVTLNPGVNYKEIELVKPLKDFTLYGYITDYMTNDNLDKKIMISRSTAETDTALSVNGQYEASFTDTANSVIVDLAIPEDEEHQGSVRRITAFPHIPTQADFELKPYKLRYTLEGTILDTENKKPVAGAEIVAMLADDTLFTALTDKNGKYHSGLFFYTKPQITGVRLQIFSDDHKNFREYLTLRLGQNMINRELKP